MDTFMRAAIDEALKAVHKHDGGPFGAVVVKDGVIIGRGHNQVVSSHDPTAHAEVMAIRDASKALGRFDLSDCVLYTTCEPCPMCYSATHWAKIEKLYYGATRQDAANIGFDDNYLYEVLNGKRENEQLHLEQFSREACMVPFRVYEEDENRVPY